MNMTEPVFTTWVFTHEHPNDTRVTFTPGEDRSELELSFDHEDPDVGTELLVYGGDGTFAELSEDLYEELYLVNDKINAGEPPTNDLYEDYTLNAMAAFESVMSYLKGATIV